MLEATTQRLYSVLDFLDDVRRLPLKVRAAKLISGMARTSKRPGMIEGNQSDLAFTLGVSRVSIGKALAALQQEGILALGYGYVFVPDLARLERWIAAPCSRWFRGDRRGNAIWTSGQAFEDEQRHEKRRTDLKT